jgi:hypothetical protein
VRNLEIVRHAENLDAGLDRKIRDGKGAGRDVADPLHEAEVRAKLASRLARDLKPLLRRHFELSGRPLFSVLGVLLPMDPALGLQVPIPPHRSAGLREKRA